MLSTGGILDFEGNFVSDSKHILYLQVCLPLTSLLCIYVIIDLKRLKGF